MFLNRIYFPSNDGSQNTFVYQPILDTLELKEDKGIDYVCNINVSKYKMLIKFDKDALAVHKTVT